MPRVYGAVEVIGRLNPEIRAYGDAYVANVLHIAYSWAA